MVKIIYYGRLCGWSTSEICVGSKPTTSHTRHTLHVNKDSVEWKFEKNELFPWRRRKSKRSSAERAGRGNDEFEKKLEGRTRLEKAFPGSWYLKLLFCVRRFTRNLPNKEIKSLVSRKLARLYDKQLVIVAFAKDKSNRRCCHFFYFRIWNTDDHSQIYTDVREYFWIEMYRSKLLKDATRLIKTSLRRLRSTITAEENFQREKYFLFVFARSL